MRIQLSHNVVVSLNYNSDLRIENPRVGGSIPSLATILEFGHIQPGDYTDPGWYDVPNHTVASNISDDSEFGLPIIFDKYTRLLTYR